MAVLCPLRRLLPCYCAAGLSPSAAAQLGQQHRQRVTCIATCIMPTEAPGHTRNAPSMAGQTDTAETPHGSAVLSKSTPRAPALPTTSHWNLNLAALTMHAHTSTLPASIHSSHLHPQRRPYPRRPESVCGDHLDSNTTRWSSDSHPMHIGEVLGILGRRSMRLCNPHEHPNRWDVRDCKRHASTDWPA